MRHIDYLIFFGAAGLLLLGVVLGYNLHEVFNKCEINLPEV